jgi:hypothetical protein
MPEQTAKDEAASAMLGALAETMNTVGGSLTLELRGVIAAAIAQAEAAGIKAGG